MRCGPHDLRFTVYPPGHVPYGRQAIAPVTFDGGEVRDEEEAPAWSATGFGAALEAARGHAWSRDDPKGEEAAGGSDRWWSTQGRRLARLMKLVGVSPALDLLQRQRLAEVLVVSLALLVELAKAVGVRAGYRRRGLSICAVLHELPRTPRLTDRLAAAGSIAGLWGAPYRWDDDSRTLRRLYPNLGTRDPPTS